MAVIAEPIDSTHAACLAERDRIRAIVRRLRADVARWEPSPPPRKARP